MNWKEGLKRREVAYGSLPIYSHFRVKDIVSRNGLAHISRTGRSPVTAWLYEAIKLLCVKVTTDFTINDWHLGGYEQHRAFMVQDKDPVEYWDPKVKGLEIQFKPNHLTPGQVEKLLIENEKEFLSKRINYFDILPDGYLLLRRESYLIRYISTPSIRDHARLRLGSLV